MDNKDYFYIPQIKRRNQMAMLFKFSCAFALAVCIFFLVFFLYDMVRKGYSAFEQTYIKVEVHVQEKTLKNAHSSFSREVSSVISRAWIRDLPNKLNQNDVGKTLTFWALANAESDQYIKNKPNKLKPNQIKIIEQLREKGDIKLKFNAIFFLAGDSKIPENAGFLSAMVGSVLTMLVTMLIAVPLGVASAIYLQEFAPDSRFTQFIEININNLAAIPSILFGLLGLAIFINFFGLPRSAPIAGGMTLALMSLPIIIVSSKAALKAVPDSIRQAGFGLGLTKWQIVKDHVLPLAMPGILTGSIIALAQAIGETAPLILVGMIAFVPDAPTSIFQASTVMPAQIYTWSGMPEKIYIEKTAAGILVLLGVLLSLNTIAIVLRKKFTRKY